MNLTTHKTITVDIVFPVYYKNLNLLEESTVKVLEYVKKVPGPYSFKVIISINGPKTESLISKTKEICQKHDTVAFLYEQQQGKGHGVFNAWRKSQADIVTYMDIDLAASLNSFESLIDEVRRGADMALGSRYLQASKSKRTMIRYIVSKIYHIFFINIFLGLPIKDVQCGFKAVRREVAQECIPHVHDYVWFFEAEMIYIAHKLKKKIVEVPVDWTECEVSGVRLLQTSLRFMQNIVNLKLRDLFG